MLVVLYLITVFISYLLLRAAIKHKLSVSNQLMFEEIAILIVMILIPVLNIVITVSYLMDVVKNNDSSASLIERFFFLK